ncbi:DUF1573 domain-containing protein [Sanyastnella coralliicola]|uniref:DUF1573 domain-containing protein n=1 Tax=Sanyastnella coralliicola TaxID=3069118 RepID=UPI0027B9FFB6|nr:DUF1573 domain-containing protein [Longitalea sp. SCSIO 12813]
MSFRLIVTCLCLLPFFASAQSLKQWTALGDDAWARNDVLAAAEYYAEAYAIDSADFDMTIKYAEALRASRNSKKAEYLYAKAFNKDKGKLFELGQFRLAEMQKANGKYIEALRNYKKFSKKYKRKKDSYLYRKSLQEIESCTYALNARRLDGPVTVERLPGNVNTTESEFAPFLFDSTLFYSSFREEANHISFWRASMEDSLYNIDQGYAAKFEKDFDSGNLVFSPDRSRAYYVECPDSSCRIMEAEVVEGRIQPGRSIPTINSIEYNSTMPWVGLYKGQEVLFYCSDRPGTRGQLDIWWTFRNDDGSWQAPANAGDNVNTPDNELSPYFINEQLFFSSNWHVGFGGYDVFRSKGYPRSFQEPENLGYPVNSSQNDLYYRYFDELNGGLMASNRPGSLGNSTYCCNDLYLVQFRDSLPVDTPEVFVSLRQLNEYLPVTLYFHNDEPNPNTRDTTTTLSYSDCFDSYQQLKNKYLKENAKGLSGDKKEEAEYDVEDFYSLFLEKGFNDLSIFSDLLLQELEKGFSIQLTIKGFASPRAESDYNVNLTRRRIASLVNYLNDAKDGAFMPYINGEADNHATLTFTEVPFGEYEADQQVSDDLSDEQESIYSRGARLERKIEIQSVQRGMPDSLFAASGFDKLVHNFGLVTSNTSVETLFRLTNNGTDTLRIDSIASSCGCTVPTLEKTVLAPEESTDILVVFTSDQQKGQVVRSILLFTNEALEPREIQITAEIQ